MERSLSAQTNTQSSLQEDGRERSPWRSVRGLLASKACACCGKQFFPRIKEINGKKVAMLQEEHWNAQVACSISCAKKLANPMSKEEVRRKVSAKLREIRHKPIKRGGNGQLLPLPQLALLHALGVGWESEYAVATKMRHLKTGYPTCYKLDLACPEKKIGIELDGGSHCSLERRAQDLKKTEFFISQGWSIYRVSNARALNLYSTFTSTDILLTSLRAS